jgi:hypothetical protein
MTSYTPHHTLHIANYNIAGHGPPLPAHQEMSFTWAYSKQSITQSLPKSSHTPITNTCEALLCIAEMGALSPLHVHSVRVQEKMYPTCL